MRRARTLCQLMACLRGDPPADCRWEDVLALANQSLVTPQLAATLDRRRDLLPEHVAGFLDDVRARNRERNRRLWLQLDDALAALASAGIMPTLLKGAARRAVSSQAEPFDRMLSDIDLLVAPSEAEAAVAALSRASFAIAARYEGASVHVVAELGRPQDPGYIDLHQRPPGPPGLSDTRALALRRTSISLNGRPVLLPDDASQLLYLVLHDQFHDGGYWRGGFDLRHLIDVAALAPQLRAGDWRWLHDACGTPLVRAALDAMLLSAQRLLGGEGPRTIVARHAVWTYRRWFLQYAVPAARFPLAAAAVLLDQRKLRIHRGIDVAGRAYRPGERPSLGKRILQRLSRARRIMSVVSGKI